MLDLDDFKALNPFFRIIEKGLESSVAVLTANVRCLVVLAVCCEPVSDANSLITGKVTGNVRRIYSILETHARNYLVNPEIYGEIP
jgi:hypothetical protein